MGRVMTDPKKDNLRQHRAATDRNLLIGFFVMLLTGGTGLIYLFYGGMAAGAGLVCIIGAAFVVGAVFLVLFLLGRLSDWLENRDN